MWKAAGNTISMANGDFGISLPMKVDGVTLDSRDSIQIVFVSSSGSEILSKTFDTVTDNTVQLVLTEEESALFSVGSYPYRLDWFRDGAFMCNLIPMGTLKVVKKA